MFNNNNIETSSSSSSDEEEIIKIIRRPKILGLGKTLYRRRGQYLNTLDDLNFFNRFRLTKPTVLALLQGGRIEPITQLLLALRFYATGNILLTAGDFTSVSKTFTSRIIRSFLCNCISSPSVYKDVRK
ncbi:hypothetical protein ABEB36_012942 [Hypothenemus hampei]|uniref:Uncharacterized protein n=1 Tax=Hypothenemus hampei TaxID=57062 RepID=A0ABD1E743_HYPHA